MANKIAATAGRLGTTVRGFSTGQKTVAIIGIAILALGIAALATWASKPALTPLFSGLSAADASSIVEQLRTDGVEYELTNGGATILVPEESVYDERLKAASAGLPSSSTGGYSLLDTMGVTTSEFQQNVTYKRAIEGELAATVGAMKGVKTASVKLAIPKDTVFTSTKMDPTASVFIEAENGVTLSSDQVDAIVHLTSASIEGMKPTDVAVIDSTGAVLSSVGGVTAGSSSKQAAAYEDETRRAVQAMLDRIVGAGNATVAVSADISSESATRTSETFTSPANTPALSDSTTKETYTGAGGTSAGVLGPDNIAVPGGGDGNGSYDNSTIVRNNAIDKVTENRTIPGGAVARQTVSVALNSGVAGKLNMEDVQALVESAAGFDGTRGDVVTVAAIGFDNAAADEAKAALKSAAEAEAADRTAELIRTGIIAAAIAIPLLLALILFLRRSRQRREVVDISDIDDAPTVLIKEAPVYSAPAPTITAVPTHELNDIDVKRAEISNLAAQDPKRTADHLRGFMDERPNP